MGSPALDPRFEKALAAVLTRLEAIPAVMGIVFFGSAQRNEATPTSDLDLFAITTGSTGNAGAWVSGVKVDLCSAPALHWRQELDQRKAAVIEAFATGTVVLDRGGGVMDMVSLARRLWREGPSPLTPLELNNWRLRVTGLIQDVEGCYKEPADARLLGSLLVPLALEAYCALHRIWPATGRRLVERVAADNPELGRRVRRFYETEMQPIEAVGMADAILAPFGGRLVEYHSGSPLLPIEGE